MDPLQPMRIHRPRVDRAPVDKTYKLPSPKTPTDEVPDSPNMVTGAASPLTKIQLTISAAATSPRPKEVEEDLNPTQKTPKSPALKEVEEDLDPIPTTPKSPTPKEVEESKPPLQRQLTREHKPHPLRMERAYSTTYEDDFEATSPQAPKRESKADKEKTEFEEEMRMATETAQARIKEKGKRKGRRELMSFREETKRLNRFKEFDLPPFTSPL